MERFNLDKVSSNRSIHIEILYWLAWRKQKSQRKKWKRKIQPTTIKPTKCIWLMSHHTNWRSKSKIFNLNDHTASFWPTRNLIGICLSNTKAKKIKPSSTELKEEDDKKKTPNERIDCHTHWMLLIKNKTKNEAN